MILTLTLAPGVVLSFDPAKIGLQISLDDDTAAVVAQTNAFAAESLSIAKDLLKMATISDQALADLEAAAKANADHDAAMTAKVDALLQLVADLKAAVGAQGVNVDDKLASVTALLNSGIAADVANESKIDAAIAPAP